LNDDGRQALAVVLYATTSFSDRHRDGGVVIGHDGNVVLLAGKRAELEVAGGVGSGDAIADTGSIKTVGRHRRQQMLTNTARGEREQANVYATYQSYELSHELKTSISVKQSSTGVVQASMSITSPLPTTRSQVVVALLVVE
jgi:hypothetical protein